jgi:hypothetical protein
MTARLFAALRCSFQRKNSRTLLSRASGGVAVAAGVMRGSVRGTIEGGRITVSSSRCPLALQTLFPRIGTLICLLGSSCAAYAGATALSGKSAAKAEPAAESRATAIASGCFTMPSHIVEARTCSLWSITACGKRPLTVKTNGSRAFNAAVDPPPALGNGCRAVRSARARRSRLPAASTLARDPASAVAQVVPYRRGRPGTHREQLNSLQFLNHPRPIILATN